MNREFALEKISPREWGTFLSVIPAQAGIQNPRKNLDPGFSARGGSASGGRRGDESNTKSRLKVLALVVFVSTPIFAFQPPPGYQYQPEEKRVAGLSRQIFPNEELLLANLTLKDVTGALQNYLKRDPRIILPLAPSELKLESSKWLKSKNGLADTVYVNFISAKDASRLVSFTLKIVNGRAKIANLRIRERAKGDNIFWIDVPKIDIPKNFDFDPRASISTKTIINTQIIGDFQAPTVRGHVYGRGILFDPASTLDNLVSLDLANTRIKSGPLTLTFANLAADFELIISTPVNLLLRPEGRWVKVDNDAGPALFLSTNVEPNTNPVYTLNNQGNEEHKTAQINAYHHANRVHDWLQMRGIGDEIDSTLPITVNENLYCDGFDCVTSCNAFYDTLADAITFFKSGNNCVNTAYDTIIYHEYGHFVDDAVGGIENRALSEGYSDMIASFITEQPLIGENIHLDTPYARTANNEYCFPQKASAATAPHTIGQAWSGFAWHLRENLMASLNPWNGKNLAEDLLIPVVYAQPSDIFEAARAVALRDDNNADLADGSPHRNEIEQAGLRHCLDIYDLTPPQAVADLRLSSATDSTITLAWTATGDDGLSGTASRYDLRHATSPITESNFDTSVTAGNPSPSPSGSTQIHTVSGLNNGTTYYFALKARDDAHNASALSNVVLAATPQDTTPPSIGLATGFNATATTAVIVWATNELATSQVEFGTSASYGNSTPLDANLVTFHSVTLVNLAPATLYHGRVRSKDGSGNEAVSPDFSFTTLEAPGAGGLSLASDKGIYVYPNPATGAKAVFHFAFDLGAPEIEIKIFDINGDLRRSVGNDSIAKDKKPVFEYAWDLKDEQGQNLASGVYPYIISAKDPATGKTEKIVKKLAILK